jgi:hypothetical protein
MKAVILKSSAKLAFTALMFAIALALVAAAASTHRAAPLFFMWIPLLGVPWILARPESEAERATRTQSVEEPTISHEGADSPPAADGPAEPQA